MQQTRRVSQLRTRAMKTRWEESLWRLTGTWEQSWEQKKERLNPSQATKEESPKHGSMYEEVCVSSRCASGTRKVGHGGMMRA